MAKKHAEAFKFNRISLPQGTVKATLDFAENNSFLVQAAAHSYHWRNDMCTLHLFVYYYKNEQGELVHGNFMCISECNKHDVAAVWLFQQHFINHLKVAVPDVSRVVYWSDGCAPQYKNKLNLYNLTLHEQDFGVPAEWHNHGHARRVYVALQTSNPSPPPSHSTTSL